MSWKNLLSSSIKLIDLHDSNHEIGSGLTFPPETRPGRDDAIWVSIGIEILEYLHQQSQETNESWIYIGALIEELSENFSVPQDDVIYVINQLSTPTKLNYSSLDENGNIIPFSTKKTALIERPRNKTVDRCRLTEAGLNTIQTTKIANSFIYAKHDAEKLQTAIITGDYLTIETQGRLILQTIRSLSQQLTKLSEGVVDEELNVFFETKLPDYKEAITGVSNAIEAALDMFSTQKERERFEDWFDNQQDPQINAYSINALFKSILTSSFNLREKISEFLRFYINQDREAYGIIRFDQVALEITKRQLNDKDINWNLLKMAPWTIDTSFTSMNDFQGIVGVVENPETVAKVSFEHSDSLNVSTSIERFIEAHIEEVKTILESSDLSLTKAIEMGWLELDGDETISDLLGIYTTPTWMEKEGLHIAIKLSDKPESLLKVSSDKQIYGRDLILTKFEGKV